LFAITIRFFNMMKQITQVRRVVTIIVNVFQNIKSYLLIWIILLLVFTFFSIIMGTQACQEPDCTGSSDDYALIDGITRQFLVMMRNSLTDLHAPIYSELWSIHEDDRKLVESGMSQRTIVIFIYLIWLMWAINIFINTIIFLNLLIAEVNNTYEQVVSESTERDYMAMAQLNFLQNKYWRLLGWAKFFWNKVRRNKFNN